MKRFLLICAGLITAGFGLGVLEAAKWLRALSAPDTMWRNTFDTIQRMVWFPSLLLVTGLLLAGYVIAGVLSVRNRAGVFFKAVIAILLAVAAFWVAVRLSTVFYLAPFLYIPAFAAALALATSLVSYIFTPSWMRNYRFSAVRGLIAAAGWVIFILILRISLDRDGNLSFGGIRTFTTLAYPPELRSYPYLLSDLAGGLLCGLFIGAAMSWVLKTGQFMNGVIRGGASGVWVSGVLYAAHACIGTLIMQSAYSERTAVYSSMLLIPLAGIVTALGLVMILPGVLNIRCKVVAASLGLILLAGAAFYVSDSRNGANMYISAVKTHPIRTRTYIHFMSDGGWMRTFEPHNDPHKIMLCDRLLKKNPRSIYAAHALYLKAKCQFSSWQFEDAANSLEQLLRRYRDYHGSASVLLAYSYLAQGDYEKAVQCCKRADPVLMRWRSGEGGLILGHASEVLGNEQDALGQYTYYLVNLTGSKQGAWAANAVNYAEKRADKVRLPAIVEVPRATVSGRIISNDGPLPGIYLALVQPHIDASAPDNTTQFSSSHTVPLWFGAGATTDARGEFRIRNVPYGNYEVVVGFDTQGIPAGHVISNGIAPVHINRPDVSLPDVRFVPSIKLISPVDRISTGKRPVLRWSSYPGAAFYTVSLIACPFIHSPVASGALSPDSYQCWSHSRIRDTSVTVTPDGFIPNNKSLESRYRSLSPGSSYTWVVFAHTNNGDIISSSERYLPDREPVFSVQPDAKKGG
ncbi:MAG: tetratricopeptide repeat protein [Armatimonadota bacterium]